MLSAAPGGLGAIGLPGCLAAVNAGLVETLVVPEEGLVPGYGCGRCGALGEADDGCPDWAQTARPVPDLLEEMAARTADSGGQIAVFCDLPFRAAARFRYPLPSRAADDGQVSQVADLGPARMLSSGPAGGPGSGLGWR